MLSNWCRLTNLFLPIFIPDSIILRIMVNTRSLWDMWSWPGTCRNTSFPPCCVIGQHNTLRGNHYLPSSSYMGSQRLTIGQCLCDWLTVGGGESMPLPHRELDPLSDGFCRYSRSVVFVRRTFPCNSVNVFLARSPHTARVKAVVYHADPLLTPCLSHAWADTLLLTCSESFIIQASAPGRSVCVWDIIFRYII